MEDLFLVIPNPNPSKNLNNMINKFCENFSKVTKIANSDNLLNLKNKKILFAIEVGFSGIDLYMWSFLENLKIKEKDFFMILLPLYWYIVIQNFLQRMYVKI